MIADGRNAARGNWGRASADGFDGAPGAAQAEPNLFDVDIAQYLRLALKHRFVIIGAFVAAVVIGLAVTLLSPRIYTASTTIQIDRQAARVLDSDSEAAPAESLIQGEEFFQTQYGLLRSRSLAERVIESLGLASSDAFLEQMGFDPVAVPDGPGAAARRSTLRRQAVLKAVQDNMSVSPVRGSRLVAIRFDSPDPQLSARVANAFASNFIQANLDRKFESTRYLREFLEEQIVQTKSRLEDAERQLVNYAVDQQIVTFSDGAGSDAPSESLVGNSLRSLNQALAQAQAARIAAEARWRQASATPVMNLPEVLENPVVQRLVEERSRLTAEREQKLTLFQPDYPEVRQLAERIQELDRELGVISGNIRDSIRTRYTVAANEERALQAQVSGLTGDVLNLRDRSIQYNILQREVDTSRVLYDGLLQRYKEVGAVSGVTANNVSIIDEAVAPTRPSKPRLMMNLALAMLAGLALGVLGALLLEALDETLEKPEAVEQKLGLPVLGVIPLLGKEETPESALADIRSGFSEAYYSLRTALQFSTAAGAPASLLVTSARPSEGKSTTAYAMALNLARIGKKVLLIDGDLRNPSVHRTLGLDNARGLSSLLSGAGELPDIVQPTSTDNLWVMPCGPLPPNPAELLAGDGLRRMLEEAGARFDHLVIDGPPVLGFADAPLLAHVLDGALFVIDSKSTRRSQARGALRRLAMGDARVVGGVLTKFNAASVDYGGYNYAYDYAYGLTQEAEGKAGKRKKGRRG